MNRKRQKITDIKIKKGSSEIITVYINNEIEIDLNTLTVWDLRLHIGDTISKELFAELNNYSNMNKAKGDAIRYLSYRPRSKWEIEQKLRKNHYPFSVIHQTIDWLQKNDLVNDYHFSKMWIKDRINKKPMGKRLLEKELIKKGIDRKISEEVIEHFLKNEINETELAYRLIEKKRRSLKLKGMILKSEQVSQLLRNRGFSFSVIEQFICETRNNDTDL